MNDTIIGEGNGNFTVIPAKKPAQEGAGSAVLAAKPNIVTPEAAQSHPQLVQGEGTGLAVRPDLQRPNNDG